MGSSSKGAFKVPLSKTVFLDKGEFSVQHYIQTDEGLGFNALLVTVKGRRYLTRIKNITRVYLVIEGKGTFTLDGKEEKVKKGDLFVIKSGHDYLYEGTMTLFEFNVPGATPENQENID